MLFGQTVAKEDVVTETLERRTRFSGEEDALRRSVKEQIAAGAELPDDLAGFETDPHAVWIELNIGLDAGEILRRAKPQTMSQAVKALAGFPGCDEGECLKVLADRLIAMSDIAEGTDRAFMAFKLHPFLSGAGHAAATLEPSEQKLVDLSGELYHRDRPDARLYPLFFCRSCGQEAHSVSLAQKREVLARSIDQTPQDAPDDDGTTHGFLVPDADGSLEFGGDIEDYPNDWIEQSAAGPRLKPSHRGKHDGRLLMIGRGGRVDEEGFAAWFFPGK